MKGEIGMDHSVQKLSHRRLATHRRLRGHTVPASYDQEQGTVEVMQTVRYAGFWMRLWAFLFDTMILSALSGAIIGTWLTPAAFVSNGWGMYSFIAAIVYGLVTFAYFALMTKWCGQTLGKMLFGLRVIRTNGHALTWGDVFFREGMGRLIQQSFALLYIMYLVVAFTPKKQGIHDFFADTCVVFCDSLRC